MLIDLPKRLNLTRRFIDPRGATEGVWITEKYEHPDRPNSIIRIRYNQESDKYLISGESFERDSGLVKIDWNGVDVFIDPKNDILRYFYELNMLFSSEKNTVVGNSTMRFGNKKFGRYISGDGYFQDTRKEKVNYYFRRITAKEVLRNIGKKDFDLRENREEFMINYHKYKSECLKNRLSTHTK